MTSQPAPVGEEPYSGTQRSAPYSGPFTDKERPVLCNGLSGLPVFVDVFVSKLSDVESHYKTGNGNGHRRGSVEITDALGFCNMVYETMGLIQKGLSEQRIRCRNDDGGKGFYLLCDDGMEIYLFSGEGFMETVDRLSSLPCDFDLSRSYGLIRDVSERVESAYWP